MYLGPGRNFQEFARVSSLLHVIPKMVVDFLFFWRNCAQFATVSLSDAVALLNLIFNKKSAVYGYLLSILL